jgi:hypothetical protein
MTYPIDEARWRDLESNAHLPEIQELIRQEIQNGTIRTEFNLTSGKIKPI